MTQRENNQAFRENGQVYRENGQVYRDNQQLHQEYRENRENINTKDFLIGTLIGGIVGAATALFMAPKSGKELRGDLNTQTTNLLDKTEKIRQTAMEKGTQIAGVAKDRTNTITETVTSTSQNLMNKVKTMTGKDKGTGTEEDSQKYGLSNTADSIKAVVPNDYADSTDDMEDILTSADMAAAEGIESASTNDFTAGTTTSTGSTSAGNTTSGTAKAGTSSYATSGSGSVSNSKDSSKGSSQNNSSSSQK
ncbi:gas vesicle protein [Peribacillus deserti]|uniref:Gas vesicle protein n=1 Tax=Peribacillus deserti TaxID=673318 RepID=A0ABS2QIS4_9BACI|nr:YtxH domain-containing protein [Peribacillus deserti]MBM7692925.1 gas vesicle protein [Peribacillus deserti]